MVRGPPDCAVGNGSIASPFRATRLPRRSTLTNPGPAAAMSLEPGHGPARHICVRSLVIVLALLVVAGCSSRSNRPYQADSMHPPANLQATPRGSVAPMSARVILPSQTMTAGSSMSARVVVGNNTGRAIRVTGCVTLFQVVLFSNTYHPTVSWLTCLQVFTIPVGQSSYSTTVRASYNQCSQGRPRDGLRACLPNSQPPPLPPGKYRAVLFPAHNLVPIPPALTVHVRPAVSAP